MYYLYPSVPKCLFVVQKLSTWKVDLSMRGFTVDKYMYR